MPHRLVAVVCACAATASGAAPPSALPASPAAEVTLAGTLRLPDESRDAAGQPHRIVGMSGIAWLGDDRYAIVTDAGPGLVLLRVAVSATGAPTLVDEPLCVPLAPSLDWEDVAVCPPGLGAAAVVDPPPRAAAAWLLACEETTPALHVVEIATGRLRDGPPLPEAFRTRRPNRGPEGLAVEPDGSLVWTATEEALPADGPASAAGRGTVVRIVALATAGAAAAGQFAYAVDPPHALVPVRGEPPQSGLVALAALGGGKLLVLERSGGPGIPPFESRLYEVDTGGATDVADVPGDLAGREQAVLAKRLLWRAQPGCNLEGLALGPPLPSGERSLLAVADNGGLGTPNLLLRLAFAEPGLAGTSPAGERPGPGLTSP